jgi:sugar lactone lactonase YvrE
MAGRGTAPHQFGTALRSIAIDSANRLHAAGDAEVKLFDHEGVLRRRWPTAAAAHAVAVADDGRVFVGEPGQVEIFDEAGAPIDTWRDPQRLGRVTAIGFARGDVLLADAAGRALRRYDAHGRFVNDIGRNNRTQGFRIPNGVLDFAVDADGVIHAANPGKHRVERYTPDDRPLGHIGRFDGIDPAGFSGCCNPTNVTVVGRDRIYVTEKAPPRVKVYDFAGTLLSVIATGPYDPDGPAASCSDTGACVATDVPAGSFDPNCKNMDLAVDRRGRVYVVDTVRLAILAFEGTPNT